MASSSCNGHSRNARFCRAPSALGASTLEIASRAALRISLSALDEAVGFYEHFGFTDMTCDDLDDDEHIQTRLATVQ